MFKTILCLLLLVSSWGAVQAASPASNRAADGPALILENSTMPLPTAVATLIVSPLARTNGTYVGDFKLKIFPYFFKNQKGRLVIEVSDETLAAVHAGKPVVVTGTATSAKSGVARPVEITVTPKDGNHGSVSLWFMAGGRKMIFTPAYQFTNNVLTLARAPGPPPALP
jgi:hypothetical protein